MAASADPWRRAREVAAVAIDEAQTDIVGLFEVYGDMNDEQAEDILELLGEISEIVRRLDRPTD